MIFKFLIAMSGIILLMSSSHGNGETINLVTTTPDLAWAARKVGGKWVTVKSLTTGREDFHYVDAVPNFIRVVSQADIVCLIGLGLEVGWLPKVLSKSGNAGVQPGGPGYCETGKGVKPIEVPKGNIDRSMGDVHPEGNPHFWLSPQALTGASKVIMEALIRVDPKQATSYHKNYSLLREELISITQKIAQKLKGWSSSDRSLVIQYHKEFSYFFHEFSIRSLGSIEEKPGVLPSAGRLAAIGLHAKDKGIRLALAKPTDPQGILNKFTEISKIPVKRAKPSLIIGELEDYSALLNQIADLLLQH